MSSGFLKIDKKRSVKIIHWWFCLYVCVCVMCTVPVLISVVVLGFLYGAAFFSGLIFIALPRLFSSWIGFSLIRSLRRIPFRPPRFRLRPFRPIRPRPRIPRPRFQRPPRRFPLRYNPSYGNPRTPGFRNRVWLNRMRLIAFTKPDPCYILK